LKLVLKSPLSAPKPYPGDSPEAKHFVKYGLCKECYCWPCMCGAQPRLELDDD
jgi:hypothetical protein